MPIEDDAIKKVAAEASRKIESGAETAEKIDAEQLEQRVTTATDEVVQFGAGMVAQIEKDQQRGVAPVEAGDIILEANAVVENAKDLSAEYLRRLFAIVGEKWQARREKKLGEQLAIPDNPKIIADLRKKLSDINQVAFERARKEEQKAKKARRAASYYDLFQDAMADPKLSRGLVEAAGSFRRANKSDFKKWEVIQSDLAQRLRESIAGQIRAGKVAEAESLYELYPGDPEEKNDSGIMDAVISDFAKELPPGTGKGFDAKLFFARREYLESYLARKEKALQKAPALLKLFRNYRTADHRYFAYKAFGGNDQAYFLASQSPEIITRLERLPTKLAERVAVAWEKRRYDKDGLWPLLLAEERDPAVVEIFLEIDALDIFSTDQKVVEEVFRNFNAEQLSAAWAKVKPSIDYVHKQWRSIYGYLVISTLDFITADNIREVPERMITTLTATAEMYGFEALPRVFDERSFSEIKGRGHFTIDNNEELERFAIGLESPLRDFFKRCVGEVPSGPVGSTNDQLSTCLRVVENFTRIVQGIPKEQRLNFFATLEPEQFIPLIGSPDVSSEQMTRFLEFHTSSPWRITLADFYNQVDYFNNERYPVVVRGRDALRREGVRPKAGEYLSACEQAGKLGSERGIQLYGAIVQTTGEHYVSNINSQPTAEPRTAENTRDVFSFAKEAQGFFSSDPTLAVECLVTVFDLKFDESDKKIIERFLNNTLDSALGNYKDAPIIEGRIIAIAKILAKFRLDNDQTWQRFARYSSDQKVQFIKLYKLVRASSQFVYSQREEVFPLVESGQAARIVEFAEAHNAKGYSLPALILMEGRKDCIGLFNYVLPKPEGSNIDSRNELPVLEKLIALKDAGLPDSLGISAPHADRRLLRFADSEEFFLRADASRIILVAQELIASPNALTVTLDRLLYIRTNLAGDDLRTLARMCKLIGDLELLWNPPEERITLEEEARVAGRIAEAERAAKRVLNPFERTRIFYCSEKGWGKMVEDPDLLEVFLRGGWGRAPDKIFDFSPDLLHSPRLWERELPEEMTARESDVRKHFMIFDRFQAAEIKMTWDEYIRGQNRDDVLAILDSSPWLFDVDSLKEFGVWGIEKLAEFTGDQLANIREKLPLFSYEPFDLNELGKFIITVIPEMLASIREFGARLRGAVPWSTVKEIEPELAAGVDPAVIIEKSDLMSAQERNEDGSTVFNFGRIRRVKEWRIARVQAEVPGVGKELMELIEKIEGPGFPAALKRLASCSPQELINLEEAVKLRWRWAGWGERKNFFENDNYFVAARHENFPLFLEFLLITRKKNNFFGNTDYFENMAAEELGRRIGEFTPEIVEAARTFPDFLSIDQGDFVSFLAEARKEEVVSIGERLYKLFGERFHYPVYNLFTMTLDEVTAIESLKSQCLTEFDPKTLQGLSLTLASEEKRAVDKVLAILWGTHAVDIDSSLAALETVDPAWRPRVLQSQVSNLGWGLLERRAQLRQQLGFDEDTIAQAILKLYGASGPSFNTIDEGTAEQLVMYERTQSQEDKLVKLISALFKTYQGSPDNLLRLVIPDGSALSQAAVASWEAVPPELRQSHELWEKLVEFQPAFCIEHLAEMPSGFLTDSHQSKLVNSLASQASADKIFLGIRLSSEHKWPLTESELGILVEKFFATKSDPKRLLELHAEGKINLTSKQVNEGVDLYIMSGFSLNFLSFGLKSMFDRRIAEVVDGWRGDLPKTVEVLEKLSASGALEQKYFDIIITIILDNDASADPGLLERLVRVLAVLSQKSDTPETQTKICEVLERGAERKLAWNALAALPVKDWEKRKQFLLQRTETMLDDYPGAAVLQASLQRSLTTEAAFEYNHKHLLELDRSVRLVAQKAAGEPGAAQRTESVVVILSAQEKIANKNLRNRLEQAYLKDPAVFDPEVLKVFPERMHASLGLLRDSLGSTKFGLLRLADTLYSGNVLKKQTDNDRFNYFLLEGSSAPVAVGEFLQTALPFMEQSTSAKKSIFELTQVARSFAAIEGNIGSRLKKMQEKLVSLSKEIAASTPRFKSDMEEKLYGRKLEERISQGLIDLLNQQSDELVLMFQEKVGVVLSKDETNKFLERFENPSLVFVYLSKLSGYPHQKELFQKFIESVAKGALAETRYSLSRVHLDKVFAERANDEAVWRKNLTLRELTSQEGSPAEATRQRVNEIMGGVLFDKHLLPEHEALHSLLQEFVSANPEEKQKIITRTRFEISNLNIIAKLDLPETDLKVVKMKEGIRKSLKGDQAEDLRLLEAAFTQTRMPPIVDSLQIRETALKLMWLMQARAEDFVSGQIASPKEGAGKTKPIVIKDLLANLKEVFSADSVFGGDVRGMESEINALSERGEVAPAGGGALVAEESEDPDLLLRLGTDVESSCQNVNGTPNLNRNLISYIMDGKTKVLFVRDADGAMVGRSIMRLLYDEAGKQPVLHLERSYHRSGSPVETVNSMLMTLAAAKAKALKYPLVVSGRFSARETLVPYPNEIKSYGGPGDTEYVDNIGGSQANQVYTIKSSQFSQVQLAA